MGFELARLDDTQALTTAALPRLPRAAILPFRSLRRHPIIALLAAVAIFCAVFFTLRIFLAPSYQVAARISLSPPATKDSVSKAEQENGLYWSNTLLSTEIENVSRYEVLSAALTSLQTKRSYWQKGHETESEAIQRLQQALVVARVPESYEISIGLEGSRPAELAAVVNAVAAAFIVQQHKEKQDDQQGRLQALTASREKLTRSAEEKQAQRTELMDKLHAMDESLLARRERLAQATDARKEAEVKLSAELATQRDSTTVATRALELLQLDLQQKRKAENQLEVASAETAQGSGVAATTLQAATEIGLDLTQLHAQINAVNRRIQDLTLDGDGATSMRVASQARVPAKSSTDFTPLYAGVALLAALLGSVVVAILTDLLNPRLDNPQNMESVFGFHLLGWVNNLPELRLAAHFEQFRRLAFRLAEALQKDESNIFFFSAVEPGSGSSFLTTHVGRELAQMGHSVVILDANVNHPAGSDDVGLIQLLQQQLPVDGFLPMDSSDCYRRISLGMPNDGKLSLPGLLNMPALLAELRSKVDIILIDGAPLLASPDSEYLSRISDGTVLVMLADLQQKKSALLCAQVVRSQRLRKVAVVLNRVAWARH